MLLAMVWNEEYEKVDSEVFRDIIIIIIIIIILDLLLT